MTKRQTIKVTVEVEVKELREMIRIAGLKVVNRDSFKQFINSPQFKKDLASDIHGVWIETNEDSEGDYTDVVANLFGDQIKDDEDNID
jgi:hypothetical protein